MADFIAVAAQSLLAMGIEKAIYCPVTARLNTAFMADAPAKANNPKSAPQATANQTAFAGVPVRELIRYSTREKGSAPSLENANICREADMYYVISIVSTITNSRRQQSIHTALVAVMNLHEKMNRHQWWMMQISKSTTHCTATMMDHTATVGRVPKLLKQMAAIG